MPLSELEANIASAGYQAKAVLLRMIDQKDEVREAIQADDLPVLEEERLRGMMMELESAINQYRVSGFF